MDSNNRLQLNFGASGGYNNDRNYAATDGRVFPTTPSTFPQPVFPSQGAQPGNDYLGTSMQTPTGFGAPSQGGYFVNTSLQPQYGQQSSNLYAAQYQQQQSTAQGNYSQRQGGYNPNDPTSGLARQFSNQNLGSSQRQGSPFGRQPSPSSQRPRTAGASGQQSYGNHLTPPIPGADGRAEKEEDVKPPEKNPDKYSSNVTKRGQSLHALVEAFFRENISRARDRNVRYVLMLLCNSRRIRLHSRIRKTKNANTVVFQCART